MTNENPEEIDAEFFPQNFQVSEAEQISLQQIDAMQDKVLDDLNQLNQDILELIGQFSVNEEVNKKAA